MSIDALEGKLGCDFKDKALLEKAVTHSSYTREEGEPQHMSNERLEFLGDAFLDSIISEELYMRLPKEDEGVLTKYRAQIVCSESLAEIAESLDLGREMKLGRGEELSGGRTRGSILADAMEAVIAAVYIDSGYEKTQALVYRLFREKIEQAIAGKLQHDFKSAFQEIVQRKGPAFIHYETVSEKGPDHDKTFCVSVMVGDEEYGRGTGKSKKEAEQNAAHEAITRRG